jgi:hypothetical protein
MGLLIVLLLLLLLVTLLLLLLRGEGSPASIESCATRLLRRTKTSLKSSVTPVTGISHT